MVILIGQCRFLYATIIGVIVAFVSLAADALFLFLKFCEKPIKKIITLSCLLFLVACTTGSQLISEGDVRIGMSKNELRSALYTTYPSEDPFLNTGSSKMFYKENKEIIFASAQTVFYVFRNVTKSIKSARYGNGYLENWFYSYQSAVNFIEDKKQSENQKSIGYHYFKI